MHREAVLHFRGISIVVGAHTATQMLKLGMTNIPTDLLRTLVAVVAINASRISAMKIAVVN